MEVPTNATVIVNSTAMFRCATRQTDYQVWIVNETLYYDMPESFWENTATTQETMGENELYILTIHSSWLWYDGILIECLAGDNDGLTPEITDAVLLRVQGISLSCDCVYIYTHKQIIQQTCFSE